MYISTSHTHIPPDHLTGAGKEMVPEPPSVKIVLDWDSCQIIRSSLTLPQINSSQLIRVWIVRFFVVDCGARGVLIL